MDHAPWPTRAPDAAPPEEAPGAGASDTPEPSVMERLLGSTPAQRARSREVERCRDRLQQLDADAKMAAIQACNEEHEAVFRCTRDRLIRLLCLKESSVFLRCVQEQKAGPGATPSAPSAQQPAAHSACSPARTHAPCAQPLWRAKFMAERELSERGEIGTTPGRPSGAPPAAPGGPR